MHLSQIQYSVIIPTYQRPTQLLDVCLRAFSQQQLPRAQFEVIVVDDASEIAPEAIVKSFADKLNVKLLRQTRRTGPAGARNRGAKEALGEFLVFTDDDCMPAPDWLQRLQTRFKTNPEIMIGGRTINLLAGNIYSAGTQVHLDFLYDFYNSNQDNATFFAGQNVAVPKSIFTRLGGFDPQFFLGGEDRDFCRRWQAGGFRALHAPEAIVFHSHPLTLRTFLEQHFHYGCGAFRYRRIIAQQNSHHVKFEKSSFYLSMLAYPFRVMAAPKAAIFSLLLGLSQISNSLGYLCSWALQDFKIR
jgi:GT2 family glycosyltransferase